MALIAGISLGVSAIRSCLLESALRGWRFIDFREHENKSPYRPEEITNVLLQMFTDNERQSANFFCAVPGLNVYYRIIDATFRDTTKVQQAVEVEMDTLLPLPLEELVITYAWLSKTGNVPRVLGYAMKKEMVANFINIFNSAGIDPEVIDWDAVGLLPLAEKFSEMEEGLSGFLHLEDDRALLNLCSREGPEIARSIRLASHESSGKFIDLIANEMRRTVGVLQEYKSVQLQRIFVSGSISSDETFMQRLGNMLGIETGQLKPSRLFPELSQLSLSKESRIPVPLAMAIRKVLKKKTASNLRRGEFAYHRSFQEIKTNVIMASSVAGLLIFLSLANLSYKYFDRKRTFNEIQSKITSLCSGLVSGYAPDMDCAKALQKLYSERALTQHSINIIDILRELSIKIPISQVIDVLELTVDGEKIRLKGNAGTLETIDKVKTELSKSDIFSSVEVIDSKKNIDGSSFDFSLLIILKPAGQL